MYLEISSSLLRFWTKNPQFHLPCKLSSFWGTFWFCQVQKLAYHILQYIHNLLSYRGWEKHGSTRETGNVSGVSPGFHYHCFVWETSRPLGWLMTNKHEVVNILIVVSSKYEWARDAALAWSARSLTCRLSTLLLRSYKISLGLKRDVTSSNLQIIF